LSKKARVTLVPANHDRQLAEPGGREALDAAGLTEVPIEPMAVRRVLDKWGCSSTATSGSSNATPSGGGETMTGVIHHALVPFLRHLAPRTNVHIDPGRLVALRPKSASSPCWSGGSSRDLQSPHRGAPGNPGGNGALAARSHG